MNTIGTLLAKRVRVDIRDVMRARGPIEQFIETATITQPKRWN
jgi:hypothetical protein